MDLLDKILDLYNESKIHEENSLNRLEGENDQQYQARKLLEVNL